MCISRTQAVPHRANQRKTRTLAPPITIQTAVWIKNPLRAHRTHPQRNAIDQHAEGNQTSSKQAVRLLHSLSRCPAGSRPRNPDCGLGHMVYQTAAREYWANKTRPPKKYPIACHPVGGVATEPPPPGLGSATPVHSPFDPVRVSNTLCMPCAPSRASVLPDRGVAAPLRMRSRISCAFPGHFSLFRVRFVFDQFFGLSNSGSRRARPFPPQRASRTRTASRLGSQLGGN